MHKHLSILVSAFVYVSFGVTFTAPASARTYNSKILLQNLTNRCMLESQDINAINNNLTDSSGKKISIKDIYDLPSCGRLKQLLLPKHIMCSRGGTQACELWKNTNLILNASNALFRYARQPSLRDNHTIDNTTTR
jgi:hypothetical protein